MKKKIELMAQLHNRFDIEVRDAVTGELKQRARAFNVICDGLWNTMLKTGTNNTLSMGKYFTYIEFGTGTGTPSSSDTSLFNYLGKKAATTNKTVKSDLADNGIYYSTSSITLEAGEHVGVTLTEVGISGQNAVFSTHAMLEDMQGNPTSITKLSTDVVVINATVYLHFSPVGYYNSTLQLPDSFASKYGVLAQILGFSDETPTLGIERIGTGFHYSAMTRNVGITFSSVVDRANKKITFTARAEASKCNLPIRAIYLYSHGDFAYMIAPGGWFSPPAITGEVVGTGDGTTTDFHTAFPIKSGASVKVDGVVSAATTRGGAPVATDAALYFNGILRKTSAGMYRVYILPNTSTSSNDLFFENPFYTEGLTEIVFEGWGSDSPPYRKYDLYASDDFENWTLIESVSHYYDRTYAVQIPSALRTKRYFRMGRVNGGSVCVGFASATLDGHPGNIHFDTPPAAGSVITVDYVPDCIAKDSDHVFDLTVELTFGEYTPPT